jgi:hypothetical protein
MGEGGVGINNGSGRLRDKCQGSGRGPNFIKTNFLEDIQEGGVTLLGGRNFWGEERNGRGINEGEGVGSPSKVTWGSREENHM